MGRAIRIVLARNWVPRTTLPRPFPGLRLQNYLSIFYPKIKIYIKNSFTTIRKIENDAYNWSIRVQKDSRRFRCAKNRITSFGATQQHMDNLLIV